MKFYCEEATLDILITQDVKLRLWIDQAKATDHLFMQIGAWIDAFRKNRRILRDLMPYQLAVMILKGLQAIHAHGYSVYSAINAIQVQRGYNGTWIGTMLYTVPFVDEPPASG